MLSKLIEIASAEIGTAEVGQNIVKYNDWYWGSSYRSDGASYPWCVVFCAWICDQAGIAFPHVAHCNQVESYAKSHMQWVTSNYRTGDFVIFDYNGDGNRDHIGFVVSANGKNLTTIEGNYGDKVAKVNRNGDAIVGAYRPEYKDYPGTDTEEETEVVGMNVTATLPSLSVGDFGTAVAAVQSILKCTHKQPMPNSFTRYGIADGEFGEETRKALKAVTGKDYVDAEVWATLIGGVG